MTKIDLNAKFLEALDIIENTSDHLFLTGNAGTGKSTLLNHFRNHTKKNIVVLAPTGVAAVNVAGETIHSFFHFKPNINLDEAKKIAKRLSDNKLFRSLDTIVIDEISMVRADLLDCVDVFLKTVSGSHLPFGGKQMIMIGDLYQLPPVVTSAERDAISQMYSSPYFFSADVFPYLIQSLTDKLRFIELETIYRQADPDFIDLLNGVRNNTVNENHLTAINSRVLMEPVYPKDHIVLTTTNEEAETINQSRLDSIQGEVTQYLSKIKGDFPYKGLPTGELLNLKLGARVMLLNNDPEKRWINGTIGTVKSLEEDRVLLSLDNGETVDVLPFSWTMYKSVFNEATQSIDNSEVGSFIQLPLKLAWAITIHKSQGKTFDKVVIDLGRGAFAHGQTYVALSRATSLKSIRLVRPLEHRHILMDQRIVNFIATLKHDLGLT